MAELAIDATTATGWASEIVKIYDSSRDLAVGETNLPLKTFPENCPYILEEIFRDGFYPGEPVTDDVME